jgi:hypothetical protein
MPKPDTHQPEWYDLIDPVTDRVVAHVTREGDVRSDDPAVELRVRAAFQRALMMKDGAVVEELGVCFSGIDMIVPGDTTHSDLVFRNIGLLTGLVPQQVRPSPDGA